MARAAEGRTEGEFTGDIVGASGSIRNLKLMECSGGDSFLMSGRGPSIPECARFVVSRGDGVPVNDLAGAWSRSLSVATVHSGIFTHKLAQCLSICGAKRTTTNPSFNSSVGSIAFSPGLGKRNATGITPLFVILLNPVIPTLAIPGNDLGSSETKAGFLLIFSGLRIGVPDGDRLEAVVFDDNSVVGGEVFGGDVFEDPTEEDFEVGGTVCHDFSSCGVEGLEVCLFGRGREERRWGIACGNYTFVVGTGGGRN